MGASTRYPSRLTQTRSLILLPKDAVQHDCNHDQNHQKEDQAHDDLIRHHTDQVRLDQLQGMEAKKNPPAPIVSAGCRCPPRLPSYH